MRSILWNGNLSRLTCVLLACVSLSVLALIAAAHQSTAKATPVAASTPPPGAESFGTPQEAANALVAAAEKFDVDELTKIFGPAGKKIVLTGETPQDRQHASDFVAQAREKKDVSVDPKTGQRAFLLIGNEDWPFPVPLVKNNGKWFFDAAAGERELFYRRIGANELDAIQLCHGYVEAQNFYAMQKREGYDVNQYAQRIISSPGKEDGLAWQNADGTWAGPVGEKIATALQVGYKVGEPYHGYYFKILKGQGPAAPMGQMNFVVRDVMIGGFALIASPAQYGVSGVKSFTVSHDGVVYEKDLGPNTLEQFRKVELFNPDKSWTPVQEQDEEEAPAALAAR